MFLSKSKIKRRCQYLRLNNFPNMKLVLGKRASDRRFVLARRFWHSPWRAGERWFPLINLKIKAKSFKSINRSYQHESYIEVSCAKFQLGGYKGFSLFRFSLFVSGLPEYYIASISSDINNWDSFDQKLSEFCWFYNHLCGFALEFKRLFDSFAGWFVCHLSETRLLLHLFDIKKS